MTLRRTAALAAAAAMLCAAAPAPTPAPQFDRAAWKADFQRIKAGLAQGYANLDWQVERRGFSLVRANDQIETMLDQANSDVEAVVVFYRLFDAFNDPHLRLLPGTPPEQAALLPRQSLVGEPMKASDACGSEHYADGKAATSLPYATSPEWHEVAKGPFQAGLIGDIGVIRIPAFGEDRYRSVCQSVAKPGLEGRDLQLATRAELNRRLIALIGELRTAGMTKLVIDVSGNGGGSEWSSEAAAMMSAGTLKRNAPRLVGPKCDRSAIWLKTPVCSIYAAPLETETLKGTGIWTGPLAVLTDRRSASATEEFVTWLKDNDRATIAGERTYGAGCGYVDGGSAIRLQAANLHVMMPDCSRYTRDGVNEIEGITPNVAIDWMTLTPANAAGALRGLFANRS